MSDKSSSEPKAEHLEQDVEAARLQAIYARSHVGNDIPIREVLENHLDDDPKRLRRIRRRIDARLTLMLAVLYTFAFIDRANLGNANIAGMGKDLKLTVGSRYSIVAMIFFVGYAVVDIPSTMIMKKLTASIMIPSICLAFGVITIGQGFLKHWGELALCRILLGLFEGCFLPGSIFLLQVWYTRFEFQKRMAGYYLVGIASSGLSGLLAFGIEKMDGTSGLAGWRWIFIIEGIASCVAALVAYVVLIDLPENATRKNRLGLPAFLSKEDAAVLIAHIERDRGDAQTENFGWKEMLYHLRDWKCWEFGAYVMLNYSTGKANLLMFPPYAAAMPWMMFVAWFNDKFHTRGPLMIFNSAIFLIGIAIVGFVKDTNTRYGGVFLGVIGICANVPTQFGYQHANMVGQAKRALCLGMMTMGGAFGGIISGNIFQARDAPTYVPALVTCMVFQCITICLVLKNFVYFTWCNRKADRGEMVIQGQPGFRYTL